jgi:hypothetical protein
MAGIHGDSGLQESLPFFFLEGATLQRLLATPGGHRVAMASRQMARGALRTTVSDTSFCMGANIGLDNRGLLPPFQTAARNEDGTFAALVRLMIPGSFIGFLPRAILHSPVTHREFPVERFDETVSVLEGADAILRLIRTWPAPPGRSTVRHRMISLGAFLTDLGKLPPAAFEETLRDVWLGWCSAEASQIERALLRHGAKLPDTWSGDLSRYFRAIVARLEANPPITVRELAGVSPAEGRAILQAYLSGFGLLLQAWPDLVEGARELRARGTRLGRRLTSRSPGPSREGRGA